MQFALEMATVVLQPASDDAAVADERRRVQVGEESCFSGSRIMNKTSADGGGRWFHL